MRSLLLVALLGCCCLDSQRLVMDVSYGGGKCQPWETGQDLWESTIVLVLSNKTTNVIEQVHHFKTEKKVGTIQRCDKTKCGWNQELGSDLGKYNLDVVLYVATLGNDQMDGIDNPIYYGYNPTYAGLVRTTRKLTTSTSNYPFRYSKFTLQYEPKAPGRLVEVFSATSKKKCDKGAADDPLAWIGNHGIYRARRRSDGEPYFTNLYFWPRVGKILT